MLQHLVHSYNHTYYSSIGMASGSVNVKNECLVRQKLFYQHPEKPKWRFDIGQQVRISQQKHAFKKSYLPGWLEEIIIISTKFFTILVTYTIKDLADTEIKGQFYKSELQLIIKEDHVYDVEKVIKMRRQNGKQNIT